VDLLAAERLRIRPIIVAEKTENPKAEAVN
jgi:hypothetical protein